MKIGPVDIRNHSFAKKMRGIDEAEVRAYLDLVADRLEESIREGAEVREALDRANQEIREYRAMEKTLRDSLVSADRVTEERLGLAEREARLIVKNAEIEAEKALAHSREAGARYRADIEDLRRQRTTFLERFRALLLSQSKILEASARDFHLLDADTGPESRPTARAEQRTEPRSELRIEPAHEPAPRSEVRVGGISVPFEPVSSRIFEVRPAEHRPSENRPAEIPPPEPPSPYVGEEGLFATPPGGDPAFGEGRSD